MKILYLSLKKEPFDLVADNKKKEEYRTNIDYWMPRLTVPKEREELPEYFRKFDYVFFTNGYGSNRPHLIIECKGIEFGYGKKEWLGDPDKFGFVISLGKIVYMNQIPIPQRDQFYLQKILKH